MPSIHRLGITPLEFGFPFVPRSILVMGFASGEQAVIAEPVSIAMSKRIRVLGPIGPMGRLPAKCQSQ